MGESVVVVLVVLGVLGFTAFWIWRRLDALESWRSFARKHGLKAPSKAAFFFGGEMTGTYEGVPVEVETDSRTEHDDTDLDFHDDDDAFDDDTEQVTYTIYRAALPETAPRGLALGPESLLASIGEFLGAQDIQVGEVGLDERFSIKGDDPEEVRAFLQREEVVSALVELHNFERSMRVHGGWIEIEHRGLADSEPDLRSYLDPLVEAVRAMSNSESGEDN